MSTQLFAPNNQPLSNILDLDGLVPAQIEQLIPKMTPRYQRPVLSKIIDRLGEGATQKVGNVKFTIYRQPNDYISATIQTQSTSGSDIVLTLTGDAMNAFELNNFVASESGCIAQVVTSSSGSVKLRFYSNPNGNTSFNTSTDFVNGQQLFSIGNLGDINNRTVSDTPFSMPTPYVNYIGQWDAATTITFMDAHLKTWVSTPYGNFYALQKEVQTLQQMMSQYNRYMLSDAPAVADSNRPMGASLINQIKTMGGLALPLSAPLTLSAFRDAVREYITRGGFSGDEVMVNCGSQYLADIQESAIDYLLTAGKNNTIGGASVEGINVYEYGFDGLKFKFVVDPYLDNKRAWGTDPTTGFSTRSRTAVWASTDRVKTENGGDLPFVVDYYFGPTADIARQEVIGMTDSRGNYVKQGNSGKKATTVNYSLNKCTQLMNPAACLTHGF